MTADSYTKVVLVTGANQGIGYGLVRLLAERGHIVYLGARNPELGTQAVKQLKDEHGLEAHFIHLDVTDSSLIAAAKERIEKEQGRLDVLVNNAAVACEFIPPSQSKHTEYRYSFETNFFAVIELTTALMPLIRKATPGYGSIINVTSGLGSNSGRAGPEANQAYNGANAYGASKAALNSYTIALARELEPEKIRVNCICPGIVTTKLNGYRAGTTPLEAAELFVPWALVGPEDDDKTCRFESEGIPKGW
ncbi:short-chain dehydrogenase reductase sdr [Moniliophthora roreri MCA 2997]|uniref:Short-chain dehydrogenase reductase sdr n=1 Tax=Moniliophthora roreri (strain MCA 2997) TaxID=1381753 RepID=V2WI99_MONRO|nr:short-chain dehydrogenase reductase sdr [Moniliophthora roreri MCA 2997]KAI3599165.1 short-chain dehydrogenase reductase sdr [Moniliophthora roreri]